MNSDIQNKTAAEAENVSAKAETAQGGKKKKYKRLISRIVLNKQIYLMLLPVVLFYIVYSYVPMYGITLAWKITVRSTASRAARG